MLERIEYDRESAVNYANKWALKRNPDYVDFENLGGDCTNFCSQCIFAGCNVMNSTPLYGWYYKNIYDRSPSWSGLEFLYNFLISNNSIGPFGIDIEKENVKIGDIIQFGDESGHFYHSVIITDLLNGEIYVSAHSEDSYRRPLSTYVYSNIRFIGIIAARTKIMFKHL